VTGLPSPGLVLVADLSAALYLGLLDTEHRLLASRIREQGVRGENAHGLLDECLIEAGASPQDIAAICVGTGPGSFTGIRVAVAMSQGLGFARRLPLYPFSSLAALRASVPASVSKDRPVVAAIAANAGRYFVLVGSAPGHAGSESVMSADELAAFGSEHTLLITSGNLPDRERFAGLFSALIRMEEVAGFTAIARLAKSQPPVLDGVIRPNYLMASAAEEKRRLQGSGG
jgi:tRNA threonylcarbamoyladenosine biosynthesis protein TsaB